MDRSFAGHVESVLSPLLGQHTAQRAVHLAARKLGVAPASLTASHAEGLIAVIAPMLRTLAGRRHAEAAAERIREGVS